MMFARWQRRFATQVPMNGKPVAIEWSRAAQAALVSCLVKKFVHFHESVPER